MARVAASGGSSLLAYGNRIPNAYGIEARLSRDEGRTWGAPVRVPWSKPPKAKHGYSRDKRSDCRQVVIAVVLSPEGFPLAYEIMPGNTSDKATLIAFLEKI